MKQKITKAYLQNHFRYQIWLYIGLAVFALFGWNLIFSVTAYSPPPEKQIVVYFMSDYFSVSDEEALLAQAYADFPDMELVSFVSTPMTSYEGQQKFMLVLAANEGDIYVIDKSYLAYFTNELLTTPLDDYVADGPLDIEGLDLSGVTLVRQPDASYGPEYSDGLAHVFAIPTDNLYGLMEEFFVDNRGKVLLIPSYSGNKDNAAKMIRWLFDRYYYAQEPAFVKNYDLIIKQLQQSEGATGSTGISSGLGY